MELGRANPLQSWHFQDVIRLNLGAGPSFRGNLLSRMPRPCLCVFCRDRAGNLTPYNPRHNPELFPLPGSPLRLNLHHILDPGNIMTKTAPAHSSGLETSPLRTGLRWMYRSFSIRRASLQTLKS